MKVVTEGLTQNGTVADSTTCCEKKKTNDCSGEKEANMLKKGEITLCSNCEDYGSGSEDESNTSVKVVSSLRVEGDKEDSVDTLTTQVMKMKVSTTSQKDDSLQKVTDKLSIMSVHETEDKDGRKSPQLLSRGPDGGKPSAYSQVMYGQQDWSAIQANVRMKAQSGKRGYEDEINPYKYVRNAEPVENGDYTEMSFLNAMSDGMTHSSSMPQSLMTQPQMTYRMSQQPFHRPMTQNNLNQPQTSAYQDVMSNSVRNVMCGGSVTVVEQQQALFNQDLANQGPGWDPDGLLALLQDTAEDPSVNPAYEQSSFPQKSELYPHQVQNQFLRDEQIMTHQVNGLDKAKRSHSGEDSGYDSEVSRMSSSNSPYSQESVFSPEPVPSPQTGGLSKQTAYMPQMAYSSNSNMAAMPLASSIGSPHSVDSGITSDHGSPAGSYMSAMSPAGSHMSAMSPSGSHMSAMSPAGSHMSAMSPAGSHMSAMSPAGSHMSAMSPAHVYNADSPTPSPGTMLKLPAIDGQTPDSIMSELTKPIPHSPTDQQMPPGQYIDQHLGELKDLYDVIASDLKDQQQKRNSVKEPAERAASSMSPQGKIGVSPKAPEPAPKKTVPEVSKAPQSGIPVSSTTMTPVILKPVTTGAQMTPVLTQNAQVIQMGQGGKVPVVGQPVMSGQNIVWVPVNTAPPIIVVRQTPPANQKKGGPSRPRPILPKMPSISPGSSKASSSVTPSTGRTSINSSPQTKPQVIASNSPAVISALASQPGNQHAGKMGSPVSNKTANRPMTAQQLQQQQLQMQAHQATQAAAQGMMRQSGTGIPHHLNPAMDSCAPNKLNLARRYIAEMKKEDLHFQDQDGDTYLHVAICRTDPYLVKAILERLVRENLLKELIDRPNKKRQTPLYVAVADNQPVMVRELVQCGAEPDCLAECQWNNGMRKEVKAAIHCAAQGGQAFTATLAELLKAKGINLNLANSEGLTAVHCAIQEHGKVRGGQVINSIPTVEMLIRAGADPNVQDKKSGKTPLMYAIETKDYNLVLTMVNLIDKDKLRLMLKTQTFDGSNCSKICSGLRVEPDVEGWRKINSLILSVSNGSDSRLCDSMPMIPS